MDFDRLIVQQASRSKLPKSANAVLNIRDLVHIFEKEINQYSDPAKITSIDEGNRIVQVGKEKGISKWYPITQIKPYDGACQISEEFLTDIGPSLLYWSVRY